MAIPGSEQPFAHDSRLHLLIAEASGNAALVSTVQHLRTLSGHSAIYNKLHQHFTYTDEWEIAHAEHLKLLRALKQRQPAAAARAMRNHLLSINSRLGLDANESNEM